MKKDMKKTVLLIVSMLLMTFGVSSQTISVIDTVMTTYPFSDPTPTPEIGKIYPYWSFQQYATKPEPRSWKMVVLENDWLHIEICPEIGGKIWSIRDRATGRELLYRNDVVKFREIALRGPWTSGGIEFNFGVIGHAPSCSCPVDWRTEKKADGTVSCFIGVNEMTCRSRWTTEISLPKDAAYVRTSFVWYNQSREYQPYYTWTNAAFPAAEDLVLVYPGTAYLGHDGQRFDYPVDGTGHDLRLYKDQAHEGALSLHVVGSHKPFFGAYYRDNDWGMMHYALRDEKLGRKFFSWGQSGDGDIWIDLLTDCGKQYVEMQGGRLYNQNMQSSSQDTPFRQTLMMPFMTEEWSEYWIPYNRIGEPDEVTLDAVVSVQGKDDKAKVNVYPLHSLKGSLSIIGEQGTVFLTKEVSLQTAKPWTAKVKGSPTKILIDGRVLWRSDDDALKRPLTRNAAFQPNQLQSFCLLARDYLGMRLYGQAEAMADSALAIEPASVEALSLKAFLQYHALHFEQALDYADRALAVDQYNAEAGYVGGLAAEALGMDYDAMDRFEVATISGSGLRSACHTELARLHFRRGDRELAAGYAHKALTYQANNMTALRILYKATGEGMSRIMTLDCLSHFPEFEKLISGEEDAGMLAANFQEELPWEDYLETAIFYHSLNLDKEAVKVLEAIPEPNVLTALWTAYLKQDASSIAQAEARKIDFTFPFRPESSCPLRWAVENGGRWQSHYLLALLSDFLGDTSSATRLVEGDDADFAPYYAYRYRKTANGADIQKAHTLNPGEWRYVRDVAARYTQDGKNDQTLSLLKAYYGAHPSNARIGDNLIDAYIAAGEYEAANQLMDTLTILPFEGMRSSHDKYRQLKLKLAAEAADKGKFDQAERYVDEAQLWPKNLGVGKPRESTIDHSTEDWLKNEIKKRRDGKDRAILLLPQIGNQHAKDKKLF